MDTPKLVDASASTPVANNMLDALVDVALRGLDEAPKPVSESPFDPYPENEAEEDDTDFELWENASCAYKLERTAEDDEDDDDEEDEEEEAERYTKKRKVEEDSPEKKAGKELGQRIIDAKDVEPRKVLLREMIAHENRYAFRKCRSHLSRFWIVWLVKEILLTRDYKNPHVRNSVILNQLSRIVYQQLIKLPDVILRYASKINADESITDNFLGQEDTPEYRRRFKAMYSGEGYTISSPIASGPSGAVEETK